MPSAFDRLATTDAAKFVDPNLFGVVVTYTQAGQASGASINVSFAEPRLGAALDQPDSQDRQPSCLARAADLLNVGPGDKLIIGSTTYYVLEARPDGFGHTWLSLTTDPELPVALTNLATTYVAPGGNVPLTWALPIGGPPRSAVELWYQRGGSQAWSLAIALAADATSFTFVASFGEAEIYSFRVRGLGAAGGGPWSNTLPVSVSF